MLSGRPDCLAEGKNCDWQTSVTAIAVGCQSILGEVNDFGMHAG